jgi:hypothetical protein
MLLQVGLRSDILQGISQHSDLLQLLQDCRKIWEAQRVNRSARLIEKQKKDTLEHIAASAALLRIPCLPSQNPKKAVESVRATEVKKTYKQLAAMVHPDDTTKKIIKVVNGLVVGGLVDGEECCSPESLLGRDAAKELFEEAMKALGNAQELCLEYAKGK